MANDAQIAATKREDSGKGAARAHRREGRVPGVLYGHGEETVTLTVQESELERLVHTISIENTIVDLDLDDDGRHPVLIRELQRHPYRGELLHVDFFQVAMDEKIVVDVPIVVMGVADGVKNKGGVLDHQLRELEVYCLPGNIPEKIEVDVTALDIGDAIHVRDLSVPDVDIETDADRTVVAVLAPTVEPEPEEELPEEELAEPEVIGREREAEEELGEGEKRRRPEAEREEKE